MRKFSSTFIILYLLFLLTQPCQDVFASANTTVKAADEAVAVNLPLPTEEKNVDACSPFCICSCCSISVGYYSPFLLNPALMTEPPEGLVTSYKDPFLGSYHHSIWQPPKR